MGFAFDDKRHSNYLGRFDRTNQSDMMELNIAKKMVRHFNKDQRNNKSFDKSGNPIKTTPYKWRIEYRGREVFKKMVVPGFSKGPVKFGPWGNIAGGMKNAKVVDAYIYRRYEY